MSDSYFLLLFSCIHLQLCCKHQGLSYSHRLHQHITLHHIVCELSKLFVFILKLVGIELSTLLVIYSTWKDVKQSGFSCTTGTHDGSTCASLEDSTHIFQDFLCLEKLFAWNGTWLWFIRNFNRIWYIFKRNINSWLFNVRIVEIDHCTVKMTNLNLFNLFSNDFLIAHDQFRNKG